ncbi:MAG: thiamine phosphate synthase [Dehalococcoidia bacterium]|nr:thiamine phosphate synthase [Dehalococcoidia bacterium]
MTFKAIDANLDRAAEGLRVLEDVARFSLNDTSLTEKLRLLRHRIRGVGTLINTQLMSARDASGDVGAGAVQCAAAGGLFLVNDHLDLVLASGAQGIHVGQTDIPVPVARHLLPVDRLLGVSAKARAQALAAPDGGGPTMWPWGPCFPPPPKRELW